LQDETDGRCFARKVTLRVCGQCDRAVHKKSCEGVRSRRLFPSNNVLIDCRFAAGQVPGSAPERSGPLQFVRQATPSFLSDTLARFPEPVPNGACVWCAAPVSDPVSPKVSPPATEVVPTPEPPRVLRELRPTAAFVKRIERKQCVIAVILQSFSARR
jgi:hypothetical protein